MLNGEKFKKEILEYVEDEGITVFAIKKDNTRLSFGRCTETLCAHCLLSTAKGTCQVERMKWLLSEYKEPIKLSILEYEFLKWLEKEGYKYIVRDRENNLFIFKDAPTKRRDYWASKSGYNPISLFNNLFKSVQLSDEEPTSIKDVLENCEVVESDL